MKRKEIILAVTFFLLITVFFFYKTIFSGLVPFPADLLVSEYNPWRSYSFLGYNPGSYPNKAQYFDVLRQLYPWKTLAVNLIKNWEFPLWNPYNFSGTPLLANFQSAVFYPFNFLYFLFPQIISWSMLVMLQPFMAGLFTYFYCRKIGIGLYGSLLAGVTFAFPHFMIVWMEYNTLGHVFLYLPLLFLSIEKLFEKYSNKWTIIFLISFISSILGGHIQIFFYVFVFVIIYILYKLKTVKNFSLNKKKILLFYFLLFIIGLGLSAVQLLPGIELIRNAARSNYTYEFIINKILIQPYQLVMFFVPDFFGNPATRNYWLNDTYIGKVTSVGIVPLFFILISLIKRKNEYIKFFIFSALFIILFTTVNPLTILLYKFNIPFISSSSPTLSIFIFSFAASILAGLGVDIWIKEKKNIKTFFKFISPILVVFIIIGISLIILPKFVSEFNSFLKISLRNLLFSFAIFAVSAFLLFIGNIKHKIKYFILVFLIFIQLFDLWRSFNKFNPFSPAELVFPEISVFTFLKENAGINRFWGYGSGAIEANFATQYDLFSPDGYDPLYPKRYGEFIYSSKNGKILDSFSRENRSDAVVSSGYGEKDLSSNKYRLKVLDMLGVKYILDKTGSTSTEFTFPENRFKLVKEDSNFKIFENSFASPRVFLTSHYKIFNTNKEFEEIFFTDSFNPSKTILLEEEIPYKLSELDQRSKVEVTAYTPDKIRIKTKSNTDALLFLSDVYYPGWKAFIDDKETKIYRANYAFRALYIPKGENDITFIYNPSSFQLGLYTSLGSFIFLIVLLFYVNKINSKILYNK